MTLKEFFVGNPKVKIKFYSDTHKYFIEDEQIPNVTNIVKILTDSQPLVIWSGNCSADKFDSLVEVGKKYDEIQKKEIYQQIKTAHRNTLEKAGDIGSNVHYHIERYIETETEPEIHNEQIKHSFNLFKEWWDVNKNFYEVMFLERVCYHSSKFCGTVDAVMRDAMTGEVVVFDWKSSSGIYKSHIMQCMFYILALNEEFGFDCKRLVIVNAPKTGKLKTKAVEVTKADIKAVKSVLQTYQWLHKKERKVKKNVRKHV
tara:strand:- start:122 stop:895 length:774 start_codon:yes stop_codon:yes gene_type:complete